MRPATHQAFTHAGVSPAFHATSDAFGNAVQASPQFLIMPLGEMSFDIVMPVNLASLYDRKLTPYPRYTDRDVSRNIDVPRAYRQ